MDDLKAYIDSLIDCAPIYVDQCLLSFMSSQNPSKGYLIRDQIFFDDGLKDFTETDYMEFEVVATKNNVSERSSRRNSSSLYNFSFQNQFKIDNNNDANENNKEMVNKNVKRKKSIKTDTEFPKLSVVCGRYGDEDNDIDNETEIASSGTVTPDPGFSYAKMLKKATDVPDQINVKIGQMVWQMKFDNYHMVIGEKLRLLWCLACKKQINNKVEHTKEIEHLRNLKKCKVVTKYSSHYVREIDSFYHCGHCNSLKTINQIGDHLTAMHPKKAVQEQCKPNSTKGHKIETVVHEIADLTTVSKIPKFKREPYVKRDLKTVANQEKAKGDESLKATANVNTKNIIKDEKAIKESVKPAKVNDAARNKLNYSNNNLNNTNNNIDGLIVIFAFGVKMVIPLASYNLICKGPLGAYCVLCDVVFHPEAILRHVQDVRHVQFFYNTPLIAQFNCHLIRLIRNMAHCALCNQLMQAENVQLHILETSHLSYFSFAITTALQNPPFHNQNGVNHNNNVTFNAQKVALNNGHVQQNNANDVAKVHNNFDKLVDDKINHVIQNDEKVEEKLSNKDEELVENKTVDTDTADLSNLNKQATKENKALTREKFNTDAAKKSVNNIVLEKNETEKPKRLVLGQSSDSTDLEENNTDVKLDEKSLGDAKNQSELFDFEGLVLVRYKSSFKKVSNASYNSVSRLELLHYCFLCDCKFRYEHTSRHVNSKQHAEKLKEADFLTDYDYNLMPLRKNRTLYHCLVCNVIILSKDEITEHKNWETHERRRKASHLTKRTAKDAISEGMKVFEINLGRDNNVVQTKFDTSVRIMENITNHNDP